MERDDNYLDWLRDEARVVGEEYVPEVEEHECDCDNDEDEDDWTERDERLASRECY